MVARLRGVRAAPGLALSVDRLSGASYIEAVSGLRPRSLSMHAHHAVVFASAHYRVPSLLH